MVWWDREFAHKLKDVGIEQRMTQRSVDDIYIASIATGPGLRYVEGKIIMDTTKVVEDEKRAPDGWTMELTTQVGDDIHLSIKLEVDYPSKHPDKKLPILDLRSGSSRERGRFKGQTRWCR